MNVHGFILPARIIGGLILLNALFPLALGIWLYSSTRALLDEGVSVPGTVVEVERTSDRDGTTFHSVFEYKDAAGKTHRQVSAFASNPPRHAVGEEVEILYSPTDPDEAQINDRLTLWVGPLACAFLFVITVAIGLLFFFLVPFTIRRVWPQTA